MRSDPTTLPSSVFRFYGNTDFALEMLGTQSIAFIHASLLNDPFDPYLYLETRFQDRYSDLAQYIRDNHPEDFGSFINYFDPDSWRASHQRIIDYFEALRSSTFIFSTASSQDNFRPVDSLYMWGHYGNGHRGVALEFDPQTLTSATAGVYGKPDTAVNERAWVKIKYSAKAPLLTEEHVYDFAKKDMVDDVQNAKLFDYLIDLIATKSSDWRFENEWRLMWRNDETAMKTIKLRVPEGAVRAIYVGMRCSESARRDIEYESRRKFPNAAIYMATKRFGEFELKFTPLDH